MYQQIIKFFWPDLRPEETKKFGLLATIVFLICVSAWLLHQLKNVLIYKAAFPEALGWTANYGRLLQPTIKFWSPIVIIVVLLIYSRLVDLFDKHKLFYIIGTFYAIIFGFITGALAARHFFGDAFLGSTLLAATGIITYFAVESFSSLIFALFWSFSSSITTSDEAKRGYPLIIVAAQLGSLIGATPVLFLEQIGGIWRLCLLAPLTIICIMVLIRHFMRVIPADQLIGNVRAAQTEQKKEGFFEGITAGLQLLVTRPYLFGILLVATIPEIIGVTLEYQMQSNACVYPGFCSEAGFARFQGFYGIAINTLSFLIALFGISHLMKRMGLRFCLLFSPICLAIVTIIMFGMSLLNPTPLQMLITSFVIVIVAKGIGFSVNIPSKEIMYIPTSKDAKFKSKGWIDTFGQRVAKQGGSRVSEAFKHHIGDLMLYGTIFTLGLTAVWIVAAFYVGTKNKQLIETGEIIE
jgi:AAA family ATP:ADP antiporter